MTPVCRECGQPITHGESCQTCGGIANKDVPSEPIADQPPPHASTGDCWRLVIDDMERRRLVGIERYGTVLQPNNGRDALVDAYQEALDLCVYLRQAIEERNRDRYH